jgi:hypothetical protein
VSLIVGKDVSCPDPRPCGIDSWVLMLGANMTKDKEEAGNQELQRLLAEYDANSGMAGLVCSHPVELMPAGEQDRIFNGFCTAENIKILSVSREKLALLKNADLSESEEKKLAAAISKLEGIIEAFTAYRDSKLGRDELRERVRKLRFCSIAESKEGLTDSLCHLIDTLDFLAGQRLEAKDSWDRLVDCVQMHDALSRTKRVCVALQALIANGADWAADRGGALGKTLTLATESLNTLESFFRGELKSDELQGCFTALSEGLKNL